MHEAAPAAPLKVPAGHAVCAIEPAGQKKPASQVAVHALVERPVTAPYVPAGHSSGAREPAGQYDPSGHAPLQALVDNPAVAPYLPAGHGFTVPDDCPERQKKPGGHAACALFAALAAQK